MSKEQIINYDEIRDSLQTFDLVLFQGRGFVSFLIGLFCKKWSHVGSIVKTTQADLLTRASKLPFKAYNRINPLMREDGVVSVFESALLRDKNGVQVNLLSERIKNYKGKVYIRRLDFARLAKDLMEDEKYIKSVMGLPYERSILELLGGAVHIGKPKADSSDFFCSELTAERFQNVKYLPLVPIANQYSPADFANGKISQYLISRIKVCDLVRVK